MFKNDWEGAGKTALFVAWVLFLLPIPHPLDVVRWGAISAILGAGSMAFSQGKRWAWFALTLTMLFGLLLFIGFASQ